MVHPEAVRGEDIALQIVCRNITFPAHRIVQLDLELMPVSYSNCLVDRSTVCGHYALHRSLTPGRSWILAELIAIFIQS